METFFENLDFLSTKWRGQGVKMNKGISSERIKEMETDFGFTFEEPFNKYLMKLNGFADFDSDEESFCFWEDSRIKLENVDGPHPKEVIWFCDYSINLCCFGFHKIDNKIYAHFQHHENIECVAIDFNEFIEKYRKNPYLLMR